MNLLQQNAYAIFGFIQMNRIFGIICIMSFPLLSMGQDTKNDFPKFSFDPKACADSTKNIKLVFEVTVSKDGEVTKVDLTESSDTVSFELIQEVERDIRKQDFSSKQPQLVETKGKITYCIIKEKVD